MLSLDSGVYASSRLYPSQIDGVPVKSDCASLYSPRQGRLFIQVFFSAGVFAQKREVLGAKQGISISNGMREIWLQTRILLSIPYSCMLVNTLGIYFGDLEVNIKVT